MNKYIAGVSGGPDSMALLDLYKNEIAVVCHVNYNKRQSAKRDFSIVKNYCKSNKIRFECLSVTKKICDKYQNFSKNFQNIARRIRYDFFKTIGKKNKINKVLIAHNLNDFVETAYMQSQRKSDSLYLGIKKENFINDLYIFRPLLSKYKSELTKYCDEHNIKYGLDETNELDIYERNRVRKVINK
jgi:tRNA(Ile)-lysidine synthase